VNAPSIVSRGPGRFALEGDVRKEHVADLWAHGQALWSNLAQVELDLVAVESCDSAGLALLVDWLRIAKSQGQRLHLKNFTAQMAALARLGELESLFREHC